MAISVKGAHFPPDILLMGVRWDVAYPLSYRPVEALLEERGGPVAHATMPHGVVQYRPRLAAAFHRRKRSVWLIWRLDETSIKVKGQWYDRYRAMEKTGQSLDFLRTEPRAEAAAQRLLHKAIRRHGGPETITIDGSAAQEAAIKSDNAAHGTAMSMRQVNDLNHSAVQEHRGVKRVTRPRWGFQAFAAAQDTVVRSERLPMLQKRQMMGEAGAEDRPVAEPCYSLAAASLHRPGPLPLHDLLRNICDKA